MKLKYLLFTVLVPAFAQGQWFDNQSINSTVLLEKFQDSVFVPLGTAVAIYNYSSARPIIATCEHLLRRAEIYVTANADSSFIKYAREHHIDTVVFDKLSWVFDRTKLRARVPLQKSPRPSFVVNPALDLGVFLIDLPSSITTSSGDSIRISTVQATPKSLIRLRKEVALGDELYFVGFPFGIGTDARLEPIVRSGSVAWISSTSSEFLLDAFSFGGNSGSPVFSKVIVGRKPGEIEWDQAKLVGIIAGHLGESVEGLLIQPNPAVLNLTRETRELQNWGLARATWVDGLMPLVEHAQQLEIY